MKSATITNPAAFASIATALTLLLAAHSAPAQTTTIQTAAPLPSSISPDVLQSGGEMKQWRGQFGDDKPHADVITAAADWAKLWQHLGLSAREPLNEKTQMAVCIYFGERPSEGYKPSIISAVERDGKIVVSYSSGPPARNQMVTRETTHPWVVAIIPKSALPVVFKEI